jgi:hypothetical protein
VNLREKINQNPGAAAGIGIAVLVIGGILIALQLRGGPNPNAGRPQVAVGKGFFTDDDGATFYVDDITNIPPYDHNGKKAYRAIVYMVQDDSAKKFVAYMESYDPADKKKIEAALAGGQVPSTAFAQTPALAKKPGSGNWVKPTNIQEYTRVTSPASPNKNAVVRGPLHVTKEDLGG